MVPRADVNVWTAEEALAPAWNETRPAPSLVALPHHPSCNTNGDGAVKGVLSSDSCSGR
jgi:hypothetical protein